MSELTKVAQTTELPAGQRKLVKANGHQIALFNIDGAVYAINNSCPHSTGPLIEGRLFGTVITCPWHGAQFDITTGKCCNGPATVDTHNYPVLIKNDVIFIEI